MQLSQNFETFQELFRSCFKTNRKITLNDTVSLSSTKFNSYEIRGCHKSIVYKIIFSKQLLNINNISLYCVIVSQKTAM